VGAAEGDRAETGNGQRNSDHLAQTRALAERDDCKRNREYRLKGCDHRRKPGWQPSVHRHEKNAKLPDTDEQTNGDDHPPAHVRPSHEEDRRERGQSEAQGGKEKRRERLEADVDHDEVHRPTDRDNEREDSVPARHQRAAGTTNLMRT
jgi:hypothetical protein